MKREFTTITAARTDEISSHDAWRDRLAMSSDSTSSRLSKANEEHSTNFSEQIPSQFFQTMKCKVARDVTICRFSSTE